MLDRVEFQQPVRVAAKDGGCGHHLGVQQAVTRQLSQEGAAVPVRPFHHWSDGQAKVYRQLDCSGAGHKVINNFAWWTIIIKVTGLRVTQVTLSKIPLL